MEVLDTVTGGVLAREDVRAVHRTDGCIDKTILKHQRRSCQSVQVGCLDRGVTRITDRIMPLIVGKDHHDVGGSID